MNTPELYLDLLKRILANWIYADEVDHSARTEGRDWPAQAHTMIGLKRLNNLQACIEQVLRDRIPGDFIETGVWRGGATILMRAILLAHEATDRTVWAADSFQGLPPPNVARYPQDEGDTHSTVKELAVSLDQVKENFRRYGLLDDQVRFLPGWFKDTLPSLASKQFAVVRLDGDMYESTMDGLRNLYPKLTVGGFLIVDDYGAIPSCRKAVEDYRADHGIDEEVIPVDWTGVYWQKLWAA